MRDVVSNWTYSRTLGFRVSGRILLISFDASDCGVVTIRLPFSSTGVERTSLSLASKKVNPVWPVDSHVNFFCYLLVVGPLLVHDASGGTCLVVEVAPASC
jgi:hypothetical protein